MITNSDNELIEIMARRLGLKTRVSKGCSIDIDDGCYWVSLRSISHSKLIQLIEEAKPVVKLPKHHQFYTTYSRAGFFREDIIRSLNDAGCEYQESE